MKKLIGNFYVKGLVALLAVFFVFYFAFGAVIAEAAPELLAHIEEAHQAMLNDAAGGEEMTLVEDAEHIAGVSEIYKTGSGYVIKAKAQGLEGPIVLLVGVKDDAVSTIVVDSNSETPDVGGVALQDEYLSNYIGVSTTEGIDSFSGATYTSDAIRECVDKALLQVRVLSGTEEYDGPAEMTEEELLDAALQEYLGEGYAPVEVELAELEGQNVFSRAVYGSDAGYGIVVEGEGHNSLIRIMVYMDKGGVVRKIVPIVQNESLDHGAKVFGESALYFYEGYSEFAYFDDGSGAKTMDSFSGATQTSMKLFQMLITASSQYKLIAGA